MTHTRGAGTGPRLVFWETTAGCNLACVHCRRLDVARELMKSDLTTAEGQAFIRGLREVGTPILVFSGGEPLFRPDMFTLASYAREQGLPTALSTNGTLITDEVAERIVASGFHRVSVSLDGSTPDTHDTFRRQPGSFQAAVEGVRRLRARGVSIQINCTVTNRNRHQLEDVYGLAKALGADSLHWFMLVPVGCGMDIAESHRLTSQEYEDTLMWIYQKSRAGDMFMRAICAPHYFRIIYQEAKREGVKPSMRPHGMEAMTKGCLAGTSICFVSHKGEVFPCGYLPMPVGNVRSQRFQEIWASAPAFLALRDSERLEGKCGACEYKTLCMGCRARAYYTSGNFMAEEPFCAYTPVLLRGVDREKGGMRYAK